MGAAWVEPCRKPMEEVGMHRKIGLALGGGGARGIAHLGVYQRLTEIGIPLHCIAGTSIGAIAGAIIASGNIDKALDWCSAPDWKKFPGLMLETHLTAKAISSGRRIERLLSSIIGKSTFAELNLPIGVVATDLNTGEAVVMREGDLISAVRASMSIPGVFLPIERDGRVLVDGQIVNPVPVSVCRAMGADAVIAVDINPPNPVSAARSLEKLNIIDIITNTVTVLNCELTRRVLAEDAPEVLIRPAVGGVMALDFRRAERLVDIGRQAVDDNVASNLLRLRDGI